MALSAGTEIGPYRVVEQIGSGGMGEVYRATDTKLGRDIAIKMLPSALAREPDRLARFAREAQLLATLNHAHIGAIYGLDEHEGTQYIAMELVEGQTLEEQLKDGPLPVEDALRIALQIAEALEAAHEKGIVHRDLKPANVMLTGDGVVKVLDFGLAKAFSGDPNQASPAHSPALSVAMTQQGLILGTAGYMSPEQASGQATDQRADIWAFGVVLFEMLTALPLFSGESVPHILADILRTEPDWNRLPKHLHPRLKLLLDRCLKKKVRDRYHSIADVRVDIEEILKDPQGVIANVASASKRPPTWRLALPVIAAAVLTGLIVGLGVWGVMRSSAPGADSAQTTETLTRRYLLGLGPTETLGNTGLLAHLALSRDGHRLLYTARVDGRAQLYLRQLDQLEARPIPETAGAYHPFFSPEGEWAAFFTDETDAKLKKIAIRGGASQTLANTPAYSGGGSWMTREDSIVYVTQDSAGGRGLFKIRATGGEPELLLQSNNQEGYVTPEVLPGDQAVLLAVRPGVGGGGNAREGSIAVLSLATGELKTLIEGGYRPQYAPTGHIIFVRAGDLWAVPFDVARLEKMGPEVPVIQGIQQGGFVGGAAYAFSTDGVLMYVPGGDTDAGATRSLVWVDRNGQAEPLDAERRYYLYPRISPDGDRLAVTILAAGNFDVWIYDLMRRTTSRLTFDTSIEGRPIWTPNSQHVVFSSSSEGASNLFWQAADGTGQPERLVESTTARAVSFSPDGEQLLFSEQSPTWDLRLVTLEGDRASEPLIQTPSGEYLASISPDGRWLSYTSDESGREQVYVRPFPDVDSGKWQISQDGGAEPTWGPAGRELFYRNGAEMLAVTVEADAGFSAGRPRVLFRGNYSEAGGANRPSYDVAPDGQRFLMMRDEAPSEQSSSGTQVVVVDNWFEELMQRAPLY
jgi:Tol biopolymer transport system component/predicted Ser/Thr protein kinase